MDHDLITLDSGLPISSPRHRVLMAVFIVYFSVLDPFLLAFSQVLHMVIINILRHVLYDFYDYYNHVILHATVLLIHLFEQ